MFTIKHSLFFLLAIVCTQTYAQEVLFSSGLNSTRYAYKNAQGQANENIEGSSGRFYELGYIQSLGLRDRLTYNLGLTLNEYNAKGGNLTTIYTWKTNYLGVKTGLSYGFLTTVSGLRANLTLDLLASSIISGTQQINGTSFSLTEEKEFTGIFLQPSVGFDVSYPLTPKVRIGLGYNYGKSSAISQQTEETLGFSNHQLALHLNFSLKKNKGEPSTIDTPDEEETIKE
jgi:hypothetical protein